MVLRTRRTEAASLYKYCKYQRRQFVVVNQSLALHNLHLTGLAVGNMVDILLGCLMKSGLSTSLSLHTKCVMHCLETIVD